MPQYSWSDIDLVPILRDARLDPVANRKKLLAEIAKQLSAEGDMPVVLRDFLAAAFRAAASKPPGEKANQKLLEKLLLRKPVGKGRNVAGDWYEIGGEVEWEMQPHENRKRRRSEREAIAVVAKRRGLSETIVTQRRNVFKKKVP